MPATDAIAVFDVGKTNKKLVLLGPQYQSLWEHQVQLPEKTDEDGDPCESLAQLQQFLTQSLQQVCQLPEFNIRAVNVSAYGASLVYLDEAGRPLTPLYNYLKPYPPALQKKFYRTYGGEPSFSLETASPVLGSLNAGLQLYRLKYLNPKVYWQLDYALHLPQYLSFLMTGVPVTEITSVGCHTALWDFELDSYHQWVYEEGMADFFPPLIAAQTALPVTLEGRVRYIGTGLHDSSAALVPYLMQIPQPFLLLSTGTWNISMNPFNAHPLTADQLQQDCLSYLTYTAKPVKASRFFAGHYHAQFIARLIRDHRLPEGYFTSMPFDPTLLEPAIPQAWEAEALIKKYSQGLPPHTAYHRFMQHLVNHQAACIRLVTEEAPVPQILVDGGFGTNAVFMNLLAAAFPRLTVMAASRPQASALGAALVLHEHWNPEGLPANLIALKRYDPIVIPSTSS